jgi:hypothetical protein
VVRRVEVLWADQCRGAAGGRGSRLVIDRDKGAMISLPRQPPWRTSVRIGPSRWRIFSRTLAASKKSTCAAAGRRAWAVMDAKAPVDLREYGVCPRCHPASTAHVVVAAVAWLICDRHQLRWLFDGDPAWLGNPRTAMSATTRRRRRSSSRTCIRRTSGSRKIRSDIRPRILAGSATRRERKAKQFGRSRQEHSAGGQLWDSSAE